MGGPGMLNCECLKVGGDNYWVFFMYGDHNEYFSISIS